MRENIPGTNPKWGRDLPDGYLNSLTDSNGNRYDDGYNFDEKDDDYPEFDPEEAQRKIAAAKAEMDSEK